MGVATYLFCECPSQTAANDMHLTSVFIDGVHPKEDEQTFVSHETLLVHSETVLECWATGST